MVDVTDDTKTFTIALTAPEVPAKGKIVNLSYPVSVVQGSTFDVDASTRNEGTLPGVFKMQLLVESSGNIISTSPQFTLAGGATTTDKIEPFTAPPTGKSMAMMVKCIQKHE